MNFYVPETNNLVVQLRCEGGGFKEALGDAIEYGYGDFVGCFLSEEGPPWATRIERYERDTFLEQAPFAKFSEHGSALAQNAGAGKRAVNWNYAMSLDPQAYLGAQDSGNCTFASCGWKTMTAILGTRILGLEKEDAWRARHGTVWYATRGHCGQGSSLSQAARAVLNLGLQVMDVYGDYDFRDENTDERYGISTWCRSGPPSDLTNVTKENKHLAVSYLDEQTPEAWMDVLYNGGGIHTGSTTTAAKNGDPVSSFTGVGPHAQSILGYDDTEEFKDWYREKTGNRLTDAVVIFSQTWGNQHYVQKNWPTHLWGRQPQGAFVLPLRGVIQRMGRDTYAYGPDSEGFEAHTIEWGT